MNYEPQYKRKKPQADHICLFYDVDKPGITRALDMPELYAKLTVLLKDRKYVATSPDWSFLKKLAALYRRWTVAERELVKALYENYLESIIKPAKKEGIPTIE